MKTLLQLILFWSLGLSLSAQSADHIIVKYQAEHGLHLAHTIKAGETVYGIARNHGIEIHEVVKKNNLTDLSDIAIGTELILPIDHSDIHIKKDNQSDIAIYYVVLPKETLYSIAQVYAHKHIDQIMSLNKLRSSNLDIGQRVLLGYWTPHHSVSAPQAVVEVAEVKQEVTPAIVSIDTTTAIYTEVEKPLGLPEIIELDTLPMVSPQAKVQRGVALRMDGQTSSDAMLVMHPTAQENSDIILYNPMMKKSIHAKVVGKLNKNSYAHDISVVISPAVARALGALDRKFWVEMSYVE